MSTPRREWVWYHSVVLIKCVYAEVGKHRRIRSEAPYK